MFEPINIGMDTPILEYPYWINLDPLVDVSGLNGLHEQFSFAIANSTRNLGVYYANKGLDFLGGKIREFYALSPDHPERVKCAGMSRLQVSFYLALRYRGVAKGEVVYVTVKRDNATGREIKGLQEYWKPGPNYERFKFLIDWVERQKIFQTYGRVYGFLTYPYQTDIPHVDGPSNEVSDFIWIRTDLSKKLYLQQSEVCAEDKRIYVDGHVVWFHPGMWHGINYTDHYCYSFRVDGVFTPEFKGMVNDLFLNKSTGP